MKKWIALLVATMMLSLIALPVLADKVTIEETSPSFDVLFDVPEGATVSQVILNDVAIVDIKLAERPEMNFVITIAYDDLYEGKYMEDLSADELHDLFLSILGEMDFELSNYTLVTLPDDVMVMIFDFQQAMEVANVLTIADGYIIQVFGMYEDYQEYVTPDDIELAVYLLDWVEWKVVEE